MKLHTYFLLLLLGIGGPVAAQDSIRVVKGQVSDYYITVTKDRIVRGRVLDEARRPLEGATVMFFASPMHCTTAADGSFAIKGAEKVIVPIAVTIFVILLVPDTAPLIGMLMLGNLFRECGVCDRLSDTAQNALMNIVTILLGISVGATAHYSTFLTADTLKIVALGLLAFVFATLGGLLIGKLLCWLTKGKINPLIGSAGVSAVPMAARVSNLEGLRAKPGNYLLMHAMGPNVAGVIGSAVAAGFLMAVFGG